MFGSRTTRIQEPPGIRTCYGATPRFTVPYDVEEELDYTTPTKEAKVNRRNTLGEKHTTHIVVPCSSTFVTTPKLIDEFKSEGKALDLRKEALIKRGTSVYERKKLLAAQREIFRTLAEVLAWVNITASETRTMIIKDFKQDFGKDAEVYSLAFVLYVFVCILLIGTMLFFAYGLVVLFSMLACMR